MTGRRTRRSALVAGTLALGSVLALPGCGGAREAAPAEAPGQVPPEAREVLAYVRQHGFPPPDRLGGQVFPNYEGELPRFDAKGRRILYRQWEVQPKARGGDGGREQLVTGSDGRAWYSGDRGRTYTEVK